MMNALVIIKLIIFQISIIYYLKIKKKNKIKLNKINSIFFLKKNGSSNISSKQIMFIIHYSQSFIIKIITIKI
ncbi:hypothetical protein LY90DRAFT_292718 [Neocallimastix californiae]|uniref:Uncharacterized protein n=1 Tax=Neocallimastix californiae TaxID=1754190 RepID=A0A1Y2CUT1_9FUNG|nr:hypothetical protein LY90DRAFT_292718 [Neocallimastix californiae]|eukprot:ORY50646.1 hypothetical protein LY90DRAFT_292718 [Neocallimastix californiae]